jgi:asparagine synthase (glutamine-hydrolysing)
VLLHLLAREGTAALSKVVGMFAFADLGGAGRRLTLARDRLGIKPLYYRILPDGLAFASELKALLVLDEPEIDASAVRDYLFHGYVPAPKSIYRGICEAAGRAHAHLAGRPRAHRALVGALDRHQGTQRR